MYDSGIKAKWDYENVMAFAEEKAETRGIQKGEHNKALDIAIRMKLANFPIDQISEFTKLTITEIETIQL
ncbi:hypothetical protein [Pedobacter sp. L105]|uniref:hypothetical protein n=1 Tax=Pedobacter sp. L105 TaxID=1641871 RepID=UPI00131D763F|nr:hypothetical protein [Pedobacter sp. L105]